MSRIFKLLTVLSLLFIIGHRSGVKKAVLRDVHGITNLLDALLGYDFVMFELLPVIVPIEQTERVNLNSLLPTL